MRNRAALLGVDLNKADKVLGLFSKSHMSYELDRDQEKEPSLAEMTVAAIKVLSKNPDGFFLMVEGGRIDHAAHLQDTPGLVQETLAFDQAVKTALEFAARDSNTLIIIT